MFEKINRKFRGQAFEMFVSSVLKRVAAYDDKKIVFKQGLDEKDLLWKDIKLDAYAPKGLLGFENAVIFEYKYNINIDSLYKMIHKLLATNYQDKENITKLSVVIITYTYISEEIDIEMKMLNEKYSGILVKIFDKGKIDEWIKKYPIDYNNAISFFDEKIVDSTSEIPIHRIDFENKSQDNLVVLQQEKENNDNFAIVLGAGVSIDLGAKSWDDLLLHFEKELKKTSAIDNVEALCKKVGGSSLITAQLCKDLYRSDIDYYWAIHTGLYGKPVLKIEYEIDEIVKIIQSSICKKHFRVLTYNFDNYLEQNLEKARIGFNVLFNKDGLLNEKLSIYHVHGFLPEVDYKTHMKPVHMQSIYLTEENYNELYNQPYSWQIASQLSFFRENICLFIGCGLSDPNIRRLLELTRSQHRKHYAILVKDGMSSKDLTIASKHFARLGIEIIWVEDFDDIMRVLKKLH